MKIVAFPDSLSTVLALSILTCCCSSVTCKLDDDKLDEQNFLQLFTAGKDAYLNNQWPDCIKYMNLALDDFRAHEDIVGRCKEACRREARELPALIPADDLAAEEDDLHFYERAVRNTLCLLRCKKEVLGPNRAEVTNPDIIRKFVLKEPYNYLQLCYYQTKDLQMAATAAFTNHVYNLEDDIMTANLAFYLKQKEVSKEDVINLEAENFTVPFLNGTEQYRLKNWPQVVEDMEESLELYLEAEERCRFRCEKPFDMGWFPDFITSVANHFTFCLRCKQMCSYSLGNINGDQVEDIFPLFYHYLQIAYFKVDKLKEAASAAESYLLFHKDDKDMLSNKELFQEELNKSSSDDESWFEPRKEALKYFQRDQNEKKLLEFVSKEFSGPEETSTDSPEGVLETSPVSLPQSKTEL